MRNMWTADLLASQEQEIKNAEVKSRGREESIQQWKVCECIYVY